MFNPFPQKFIAIGILVLTGFLKFIQSVFHPCKQWCFSIFKELFLCLHHLILEHLSSLPPKKPIPFSSDSPLFLPLSSWQPLIFLSLWICLFCTFHINRITKKCGLLCLASFTQRDDFMVCLCCSMNQHFIPFYG